MNESVLREVAGDERPHRERGGEGRRAGAQREAWAGRHSRNRIRRADAATAARRPAAVPAGRADAALLWQSWSNTNLLSRATKSQALAEAYCFLRDVEHRLQMEDNLQTHTIPADRRAQERLARSDGLRDAGGVRDRAPGRHTAQRPPDVTTGCSRPERGGEAPSTFPRSSQGRGRVEGIAGRARLQATWTRRSACCGSLSMGRVTCMSRRAPSELARQLAAAALRAVPRQGPALRQRRSQPPQTPTSRFPIPTAW